MFISSYTTIYFFVKKFFFPMFLFPMFFWLRKGPSIKYVRNWWGIGEIIQNTYSCVQGEGVSRLVCTYVLTPLHSHLFFMFLAAFLSYSVLFYLQKFSLTVIKKKLCLSETVIPLQRDQFLSS